MLRSMLAARQKVMSPAEEWAAEREKIAARKPHLALVGKDRRPSADMYAWRDPAALFPTYGDDHV